MANSDKTICVLLPLEILDVMTRVAGSLKKREFIVWIAVWRHTVGLDRKNGLLSTRGLGRSLKMPHQKIHSALQGLVEKGLVKQEKTGKGSILSVNLQHAAFRDLLPGESHRLDAKFSDRTCRDNRSASTPRSSSLSEKRHEKSLSRDALLREWGKIFNQGFPEGLEKNAAAILEEIRRGNIEPGNIKFPLKYLKAFKPRTNPSYAKPIQLAEGMKVKFRGEVLTIDPFCCVPYKNGVIPEGEIRHLIREKEMILIEENSD